MIAADKKESIEIKVAGQRIELDGEQIEEFLAVLRAMGEDLDRVDSCRMGEVEIRKL